MFKMKINTKYPPLLFLPLWQLLLSHMALHMNHCTQAALKMMFWTAHSTKQSMISVRDTLKNSPYFPSLPIIIDML